MTENDDKNDPSRFLSDGVAFRAKLIGILEVGEARGDRMCQEALQDLKVAIRAAGEHKQRITVHVAIDGLRLRDEKTGDSLYHHPVHKISFIAQDMTDSRAFGYIFGSPDSGHRFFGIKTEKSASQVVIAMRDLFQVVFELKKKEIELARLQIQGKTRLTEPSTVSPESIADLVDLEQELNSLQRGLNQMERLTPSDGPQSIVSAVGNHSSDPFGDSFASFTPPPCLPPPPSSRERPTRCVEPPFSPPFSPPPVLKTPFSPTPLHQAKPPSINLTTKPTNVSAPPVQETTTNLESSPDWLHGEQDIFDDSNPLDSVNVSKPLPFDDVFTELDPLGTGRSKPYIDKKHFFQELKNPPKKVLRDLVGDYTGSILQPIDNKTNFGGKFSDESSKLVSLSDNSLKDMDPFNDPFDQADPFVDMTFKPQADPFDTDFVPFKIFNNQQINPIKATNDSVPTLLTDTKIGAMDESNEGDNFFNGPLQVSLPPERGSSYIPSKSPKMERQTSTPTTVRNRPTVSKHNTVDSTRRKIKQHIILTQKFSKEGSLPESLDGPPEPPPRPEINSSMPPPLPPKKQLNDIVIRPPPRPPHSDNDSHYDYIDSYNSKSTESYTKFEDEEKSPPLPVPARKPKFEDNFIPQRPKKELTEDIYLTPISLLNRDTKNVQVTKIDKPVLLPPPQRKDNVKKDVAEVKIDTKALDMSLSDLLSCGVEELAKKLNTPAVKITDMTIIQLTNYLKQYLEETKRQSREIAKSEETVPDTQNNFADFNSKTFEANFDQFEQKTGTYDRYAVFREIQEEENLNKTFDTQDDSVDTNEDLDVEEDSNDSKILNNSDITITVTTNQIKTEDNSTDRYAALRSIFITDENNLDEKSLDSTRNDNIIDDAKENIVENDQNNTFDSDLKNVLMQIADDYKTNDNSLTSKFNSTLSVGNDKIGSNIYKSISQPISRNKSPVLDVKSSSVQNKSPVLSKSPVLKAPVSHIVTDTVPNHVRMTSGSLSDVISGSSPEIDNLTGSPDLKKQEITSTSESWAIFDTPSTILEPPKTINQSTSPLPIYNQTNIETLTIDNKNNMATQQQPKIMEGIKTLPLYASNDKLSENLVDATGNKNVGSNKKLDEGMSPWSSDGKEFYGSPTEWPQRGSNRDERRRRHHRDSGWSKPQTSSSSRDASPWDEEGPMEPHAPGPGSVHSELRVRRARSRRRDSWDEEEFDYDEESEHPNWHNRRQHGPSSRDQIMRSREFLEPRGPPGGWYGDRPGRTRDDYSDRSLEDLRYERKNFDARDSFERKSFDRKGGFRDDRMYYERSRHFGYNRDSCDSYEDRGDFDNWDRQDMYDRHDRDDFKHGGHKMPEHWKYSGRYATVGRGDQRRRGHSGREWGSDWGGPSDEWEQDSDPDDRAMSSRYGRPAPGRAWSGDGPVGAGPGEPLDRGVSPDGPPGPHTRQWKRPASANESDRRLDRGKGLHQPIGGSDNERDRRYRTKSRSRSRESQFSDIRPPKIEMNSLTRGRTRHQRFDNVPEPVNTQIKPTPHLNNKHYSEYNSMENPREAMKPKPKFPQSDFDEKDDFDKFEMHTADAKFEADFSQFYNLPPNSRFRDSDPSDKDSPRSLNSDTRKPDSAGYTKTTNFKFENDFCEDNDDFDNDNGLKMKVDSKQSFEDDFIPPNLNKPMSRISENANFESISEETDEKSDSVGNMESTQNDFNHRNQNKTIMQKNRNQTRENLKKSESVNIFARAVDPFDDDDFFKNGSKNSDVDRTTDSSRNKKDLYQDNLKWPSDSKFEVFDD